MSGLRFYPKSHRYRLDGQWVPGVTTILKKGLPPTLHYWSARTVAEYVADHPDDVERLRQMGRGPMVGALKETPWQRSDTAAVRGTDVHNLAEQLVAGTKVEVPEHLAGHVESCVQFLDTWRIDPVLVEECVAHRTYRYAGKLDLVADSPGRPRAIYDYKTSESGVYGETALQLKAYASAEFYGAGDDTPEKPMTELGIEASYAVHIRADGYDVLPLNFSQAVLTEFRHVAVVAALRERVKSYVGEPIAALEEVNA